MPPTDPGLRLEGRAWPEADRLFRSDARWLGSDDAYSLKLSEDRVLWLFGDTFISTDGSLEREESTFIRNSIGIQVGLDPSDANISFHWRTEDGVPSSFFGAPPDVWYWPLHGIRLENTLLLFMMKVRSTRSDLDDPIEDWKEEGPLGFFDVFDYSALRIANPDADPSEWVIDELPHEDSEGVVYGAAIVKEGGFVYAFGWLDRRGYLLRWSEEEASRGDLMSPEHLTVQDWRREKASRLELLPDCATEFMVYQDPKTNLLVQIQMREIYGAHIALRTAPSINGPWSSFSSIFSPEEASRPGVFVYAGKCHPHLKGADLVMTYASNGRDVEETLKDQSIYYPRFVRGSVVEKQQP